MLGNLKNKIARFMQGRYGADQLYMVSIVAYLILLVINLFVASRVLSFLMWVLIIWTIFRAFSRNIYKRRSENQKFLKIWRPIKSKTSLLVSRMKEIRTHRYRRCPKCNTVLRLPFKKGEHTVRCPRCKSKCNVHIRW